MTDTGKRPVKTPARSTRARGGAEIATWAYGVLGGQIAGTTLARLPRLPDGAAPHLIALAPRLAIVAAQVPRTPFEAGTLESRLRDIDWVGQYATAHHRVIAALSSRGTMLPLRLFTVFDDDASVKAALGRRRQRLAALIDRVEGRSEWVLRIHRPEPGPPATTGGPRPASGTAFLRARGDAQRARVQQARMIDAGVTGLIADLTALADQSVERIVEPGTSALAEAAFLVERRRLAAFKRQLTAASADLRREGCRLALTGPWPVYSFVELETSGA